MNFNWVAIVAAAAVSLACTPKSASDQSASATSERACPDDGPRLPETGVCQGRALAYLDDPKGGREPSLPEGCTWTVNETMLPGDEALLYRAATCKGVTTKLGYSGGAHNASIFYEKSAVFGASAKDEAVLSLFGTDPDPQGALKQAISELPMSERAKCEIRPAGIDGWPSDALEIAPTKAARAKMPKDEPITACGKFGLNEDETRYWRIKQGFAWFFKLGQEEPDFDPASMTVIAKNAEGGWGAKD